MATILVPFTSILTVLFYGSDVRKNRSPINCLLVAGKTLLAGYDRVINCSAWDNGLLKHV